MLVGMLLADVDINAGIVAGGFIPGMQYVPSDFPFACWLVGGGCWRWFTLTSVLMYYLWIKVEMEQQSQLTKGFQHGMLNTERHSPSPAAGSDAGQGMCISPSIGIISCLCVQVWWLPLSASLSYAQTSGTATSLHLG